jgi:hypothetical protein
MAVYRSLLAPTLVVSILGLAGAWACSSNDPLKGSSADADASVPDASPVADCQIPSSGLPTDLYCTGLYAARAPAQLAPGVMPYTPGVTLWSDGAEKHRYLQLPPGTKIDTTDLDAWKFPVDTKVWKEFRLGGALVETRILWKRSASKWELGTYVWDATGTTATLNTSAPKGLVLPRRLRSAYPRRKARPSRRWCATACSRIHRPPRRSRFPRMRPGRPLRRLAMCTRTAECHATRREALVTRRTWFSGCARASFGRSRARMAGPQRRFQYRPR